MINIGLIAYGEMAPFALKSLRKIFKVDWIITPPNNQLETTVEISAHESHVKIIKTNAESDIIKAIKKTKPQIVAICSYNKIISQRALHLTKFINVHHGDLPRFRGRANINWAIINGRNKIGISFHEVIPELDAGNIYTKYIIPIKKQDNVKTIYDKVNLLVEQNLAKIMQKVLKGYKGKPQKGQPTYCCTRIPEDGYIDWKLSTIEIDRLIRALTKPYPGAFTYYQGKKLLIWDAEIPKNPRIYEDRIPGRIIVLHKNLGVEVLTGDSSIIIKNVEYQGKLINSAVLIKSVKQSLGLNLISIYEEFINLQKQFTKNKK